MSQIRAGSKEWSYVSFRLGLVLAHPNIEIISIRRNGANENMPFDGMLRAEGIIDASLFKEQYIEQIKKNQITNIHVQCGALKQQVPSSQDKVAFRILLMKIGVNQILPIKKEATLKMEEYMIGNYDTVYIANENQEFSSFSYEYVLKTKQQYCWEYDIKYKFAEQTQMYTRWYDQFDCQHCTSKKAIWYCVEDKERYCVQCFGTLHRSQRKKDHLKEPLDPFNCSQQCFLHNRNTQHYCFVCKTLKCDICIRDSVHKNDNDTTNQQKKHQVMQLRQLKDMFRQKDILLFQQGKLKITNKIKDIQSKINLINKHYQLRFKQIQRSFNETIQKLQQQTSLQLNKAVGIHCQLKRKFDQLLWLVKYMEHVDKKIDANSNIRLRQGQIIFVQNIIAQQYFQQIDKKIQEIKIFK